MPTLNLPPSHFEAVFLVIKNRIESSQVLNDASIARIFLDGDPGQTRDLDSYLAEFSGVMIFEPRMGPRSWGDEGHQVGPLIVGVRAEIPGGDSVDHMRLQRAIESVVLDASDNTYHQELVDAGSYGDLLVFNQPLNPVFGKTQADNGRMVLQGAFSVNVLEPTCPC